MKLGKNERMSYARINEVLEMPNLIEIQKDSYQWFIDAGLAEVFHDISPITDYSGNLILEFLDYSVNISEAKFGVEECKERDATYAAPLKVKVRLINQETGEIKEQEIFMGDFPLMTPQGTFIINGAERVIVSQLVRSPGIYYSMQYDTKMGKELFSSTVIPNRGAWLEYETDANDVFSVRIDRTRKLPVTVLIRALGYGSDAQINDLFGYDERMTATIEKDTTKSTDEALIEIYKRLRPASRRRWTALASFCMACSMIPEDTVWPRLAGINLIRSWGSPRVLRVKRRRRILSTPIRVKCCVRRET